tara:strand:- start:5838 stop:6368 length:531 start_codon:yes stop_codon:yes gene_type:complete
MAPAMAKGMDPLGGLPSDSDSESGSEGNQVGKPKQSTAPKPKPIDYASLQKHGMKTAPNLDGIRDSNNNGQGKWGWSQGNGHKATRDKMSSDTLHHATNEGLEEACAQSIEAANEKRKKREQEFEKRGAEIAASRARERETREMLKADDRESKRKRDDILSEEKKTLREGGGGFGF